MPWNLIITAVATTAPNLIGDLMELYNKNHAGQQVTPAEWQAFEAKYFAQTGRERLLALSQRLG